MGGRSRLHAGAMSFCAALNHAFALVVERVSPGSAAVRSSTASPASHHPPRCLSFPHLRNASRCVLGRVVVPMARTPPVFAAVFMPNVSAALLALQ